MIDGLNYMPKFDMSSLTAVQLHRQLKDGLIESDTYLHKQKNDPAWSHLNWGEGFKWDLLLNSETTSSNISDLCRNACMVFLQLHPLMMESVGDKIENIETRLKDDERQVFRNARLLGDLPDIEAIKWWDHLKTLRRNKLEERMVLQGRLAERFTIVEELKTLSRLAIPYNPVWVALAGDHFGYDVLSYRINVAGHTTPLFIEVKSFAKRDVKTIYITRNEWQKAIRCSLHYLFVVWCMQTKEYRTMGVHDLAAHIPRDRGTGEWQTVKIDISSLW